MMKYLKTFEEFVNEKHVQIDESDAKDKKIIIIMKYLNESFLEFINEKKEDNKKKKLRKELEKAKEQLRYAKTGLKKNKKKGDEENIAYSRNQVDQWRQKILKIRAELGHADAIKKLGLTGDKSTDRKSKIQQDLLDHEKSISVLRQRIKDEQSKDNPNQNLIRGTKRQIEHNKKQIAAIKKELETGIDNSEAEAKIEQAKASIEFYEKKVKENPVIKEKPSFWSQELFDEQNAKSKKFIQKLLKAKEKLKKAQSELK